MSPNDGRIEHMMDMVEKYKVDGVVEVVLQACHTFNIEAVRVQRACEQAGVPYMKLETDYSPTMPARWKPAWARSSRCCSGKICASAAQNAAERRCSWRSSIARGRRARCPW